MTCSTGQCGERTRPSLSGGAQQWLALFCCKSDSVTLALPRISNGELGLAAGRRAEHLTAALATDCSLGVREDCRDILAFVALDIQEVGVRGLNQSLKFVHVFLLGRIHIQKVHFYHCAL